MTGGDGAESGRPEQGRSGRLARTVGRTYLEVLRAYRQWWTRILPLAALIFVPITLLDAALEGWADSLGPEHYDHVFEGIGLLLGVMTGVASSLLGEVLLAGMISLTLAGSATGDVPSIGQIARHLKYGRLILLDVAFTLLVVAGLMLLVVPGLLLYIMLGLAGPVVELEQRRIVAAFRRSAQLVRRDFWLVVWVLIPIEIFTNQVTSAIEHLAVEVFGHHSLITKLAEVVPEVLFGPLFAVAAVLLTLRLSALDGEVAPAQQESV